RHALIPTKVEWRSRLNSADCVFAQSGGRAGTRWAARRLPDGRQFAADRGWMAGLDQRRGAKIDLAKVGEKSDRRDHDRAGKPDYDDLQMRAPVRAVHRVVHGDLPFAPI